MDTVHVRLITKRSEAVDVIMPAFQRKQYLEVQIDGAPMDGVWLARRCSIEPLTHGNPPARWYRLTADLFRAAKQEGVGPPVTINVNDGADFDSSM